MAFRPAQLIVAAFWLLAASAPGLAQNATARLAGPELYPVATEGRLGGDDKQTRFVMDLSRRIDLRAFALADPYRVVVDLPQITFRLPPGAGEAGRGLVRAFRFGLVMQGGSRLVLDVTKPVRIEKAFVLDAKDGQPARLVLDLVATDRESFLRSAALDNRPARSFNPRRVEQDATKDNDPRPLIVVDPGHGGIDQGTKASSGELEKDIVLQFALLLRDRLEKSGKYRVVMTRTDDTFVPLGDRVRIARMRQAALFISIHADALRKGEGEAQGATVYTLSEEASDAEAERLAENENRADLISGIDLSREPNDVAEILIDFAQRETKAFSMHFAKTLVGEMRNVARMHKHPLKSAGFKVLKSPDVPSVLLELGYVSSKQDLKMLTSNTWQTKTASSMVQAVETFFSTRLAGSPARRN